MKTRVGLLGGTFNPVHRGHIELGLNIREAFRLDKVFYILAARPPHKKTPAIVRADLRWEMLTKALEPYPYLVPCDIEMKRSVESWTIDTVEKLIEEYPGHVFYFISGSEGFLKIRTWKHYKKLLYTIPFIVVLRKESHKKDIEKLLEGEEIIPGYRSGISENIDTKVPYVYIYSYPSDKLRISSTLIRKKIKLSDHEGLDDFVQQEVKKIMEENRLYEK